MVIHPGVRASQCHICEKSFTQERSLKTHMVTNTGQRAFQCHICEKSFTQARNLKAHMVTHTGQTAFQCHICVKIIYTSTVAMHPLSHFIINPIFCRYSFAYFTILHFFVEK